MATLTVPYSFNPNTAIVASEMNTNFGAVKTFVEALSAGTNIDSAAITTDKLATNTIQLLTPTGSVTQYAGSSAPTGWMFCDGAAVSRTTYAALFAVVGTTYGSGDGSTTFNLPDLKGRVPVGKAVTGTFSTLNNRGGAETHQLTSAESGVPAHSHPITDVQHSHQFIPKWQGSGGIGVNAVDPAYSNAYGLDSSYIGAAFTGITGTNNNTAANAASAHNNLQPYIVLNYIIKL